MGLLTMLRKPQGRQPETIGLSAELAGHPELLGLSAAKKITLYYSLTI
jgi:hypothetical protein